MSEETKQPTAAEALIIALKQCIEAEPDEAALAELGETLVAAVKATLAGKS
jgi:hypothetical protein